MVVLLFMAICDVDLDQVCVLAPRFHCQLEELGFKILLPLPDFRLSAAKIN